MEKRRTRTLKSQILSIKEKRLSFFHYVEADASTFIQENGPWPFSSFSFTELA